MAKQSAEVVRCVRCACSLVQSNNINVIALPSRVKRGREPLRAPLVCLWTLCNEATGTTQIPLWETPAGGWKSVSVATTCVAVLGVSIATAVGQRERD